ncbi:MAG: ATP-binding protein [Pseudomonas taetrolens]|uniref:ATP-binding protein n=1 Tax=Pseudomonas taetrolens TaxID=47884 RepID=UPI003F9D4FA1
MIACGPIEERALVFAPPGPDSAVHLQWLEAAGESSHCVTGMEPLLHELRIGAGVLVIAVMPAQASLLDPLLTFLNQQPPWSDLPVIVLAPQQGLSPSQVQALSEQLGNLTIIEAPWSRTTFSSLVQSAVRARRRQYASRDCSMVLTEHQNQLNNMLQAIDKKESTPLDLTQIQDENLLHTHLEAVGQLAGGIAHDFNNMLAGIIGSLELLRRRLARGKTDDLDKLIDLGITSANRAAGLTHRLLAFARNQPLDSKPVAMNDWLQGMRVPLQNHLADNIELCLGSTECLWTAEIDPLQLENALLHLVSNACDAMPHGGQFTITASNQHLDPAFCESRAHLTPGDYVVLNVSDNGHGMPQNVLKHAFDPFFTTKGIGQGTGLGLSMIYGFCKQSRGHVSIESQESLGTTVMLYLPRLKTAPQHSEADSTLPAPPALGAEKTVLLVEDDAAVREVVTQVLCDQGFKVFSAMDADSALPVIESAQPIDLMISDVGLPGISGRQLADMSRQVRPDLTILFITGYARQATVHGGFLAPGMHLLSKPFTLERLTAKVNEMLPRQ